MSRIEFDASASSKFADCRLILSCSRMIKENSLYCGGLFQNEVSGASFETGVKTVIVKAEALGADFAVCITRARRRVVKLTRVNGAVYAKPFAIYRALRAASR